MQDSQAGGAILRLFSFLRCWVGAHPPERIYKLNRRGGIVSKADPHLEFVGPHICFACGHKWYELYDVNYVIMALYAINASRWALQHSWADVAYWTGALWITASVTFGYSH